ncbi:MAG: hypothetical protein OHK0015_09080 [Chloroflexi bacterium OHK40]
MPRSTSPAGHLHCCALGQRGSVARRAPLAPGAAVSRAATAHQKTGTPLGQCFPPVDGGSPGIYTRLIQKRGEGASSPWRLAVGKSLAFRPGTGEAGMHTTSAASSVQPPTKPPA